MASDSKIGFVKSGSFSHINESVAEQLHRNFPKTELVVFEIKDILRSSPFLLFRTLLQAFRIHGSRLREDPLDSVIQTPLAFAFIKSQLARKVSAREFIFTFQTQSMWDASVPGVPHFVYTDHTELTNKSYRDFDDLQLKGFWWNALEKQIYANAARVFTMSSHVTRSVIQDYRCFDAKVLRVGAGANAPIEESLPPVPERYRRKEILFVGTDWERKGGPQLEAAFRIVLRAHPDARLTIVGCNPEVSLPGCDVRGRLSLVEVAQCYQRASLFCLPTRREPFGIVFIEAMLAGLPVVATAVGAVPDLVTNSYTGQLVEVDDIDGLSVALIELLDDSKKLEILGKNARTIAKTQYTWECVGCRMKSAIESCIPSGVAG